MSISITFTAENHDDLFAQVAQFFLSVGEKEVAIIPKKEEPKKEEKPKPARRGRPPKKEKAEEKPTTRRSSKRAAKKEEDISPLLMDTLKAAHEVTEEIEEGEELVKTIMKEEFGKENMSDLSDDQLKELTAILKEELELDPDGDNAE